MASQVSRANRAARLRGLPGTLQSYEWMQTLIDFHNRCAYCGNWGRTIDHFIPLARGGGTTRGNCVPACISCNQRKGSSDPTRLSFVPAERITRIRAYLAKRKKGRNVQITSHEQPETKSLDLDKGMHLACSRNTEDQTVMSISIQRDGMDVQIAIPLSTEQVLQVIQGLTQATLTPTNQPQTYW